MMISMRALLGLLVAAYVPRSRTGWLLTLLLAAAIVGAVYLGKRDPR